MYVGRDKKKELFELYFLFEFIIDVEAYNKFIIFFRYYDEA